MKGARELFVDIAGWTLLVLTLAFLLASGAFMAALAIGHFRCHAWSDNSRRYLLGTGCQVRVVEEQWRIEP